VRFSAEHGGFTWFHEFFPLRSVLKPNNAREAEGNTKVNSRNQQEHERGNTWEWGFPRGSWS
jgi:hypothetical protein